MEVKTMCYVVQYAVYKELCSTNLFLDFLLFIGTFFNKILLNMTGSCVINNILFIIT